MKLASWCELQGAVHASGETTSEPSGEATTGRVLVEEAETDFRPVV
jgi:hypothetical protein